MNTLPLPQDLPLHCTRILLPPGLLLTGSEATALTEGYVPAAGDAVFYTFALTAIAFSAAIITAYREFRWLVYVALSFLLLLSVASMDGTLAHLFGGGDFVLWVLPYLLLSATTAFGFLVVALRLEAPHRLARLRRAFTVLALLTALFPLSSVLWLERISLVTMWVPVNLLIFVMLFAQALPPLTWPIRDRLQRLLTRAFPIVVGGFAAMVHLLHLAGDGFSRAQLNELNRLIMFSFAVFSLAIVIWQVVANTREKSRAERQALESERNEARLQLALAQAEADYQEAVSAASRHRTRLATVSHDLKQPIAALRHAVDQMQRAGRAQDADKLSRAVDYVASLSSAYVEEGVSADDSDEEEGASHAASEVVASRVFARTLEQMFAAQAREQGVRLRVICPDSSILVEPLATMRLMSNLISNALAHGAPRRLLVGFRPRGKRIVFQVHDDGVGMDAQTLARVTQQGFKGADSDGHGLGLSIVEELCRAQGMTFTLRSEPGRGTSACVSLPRHQGSS
jgi:signal transduction histidine kinase